MGVITIVSVGAAIYFAMKGGGSSQVSAQTSADAQNQIASLTTKISGLNGQITSLQAESTEVKSELSIFATANAAAGVVPATVMGMLAGDSKTQYTVTTPYGIVAYVKNYKDAKVAAALAPLVGTNVQITGTHIPGYRDITVTAVNGQPISAPAAAAPTSTTGGQ